MVELCDLSGKHHSSKSPYISNSQKVWSVSKKIGLIFHKLHIAENAVGVPDNLLHLQQVFETYTLKHLSTTFCNRGSVNEWHFTAAREYSCNRVSMGRIDQSHAQKTSGVTTSIHFVISRPGTGSWPRIEDHCHKACCALVFDAVLDIRISEKTLYETYSELLRSRMVLLTLGSDNSISKLGA